jgi:anti-anti-sigma factor
VFEGLERGLVGRVLAVPQDDFDCSIEYDGPVAVVRLAGELDLSGVGDLESRLAPVVTAPEVREVVFDLAELAFIDSSGLAVLVKTAGSGKPVRLRRPSPLVREVISVTGLHGVLPEEP